MQLERERRTRLGLEEKIRELEASIFPAGLHLTYEPHESIGVLDHNTPPSSEAEEGETLEVMEVPLPLNSEEIHDEILSSAVRIMICIRNSGENHKFFICKQALTPVTQTQIVSTTPLVKQENEESPDPETRGIRRLPSVIEQAIKAEPKVEVERLPTPGALEDTTAPSTW